MAASSVTVLVRAQCPACDRMRAAVRAVCDETATPWSVIDVDGDAELRAEYGDRIPVALVGGEEHACWEVDRDRLRAALL